MNVGRLTTQIYRASRAIMERNWLQHTYFNLIGNVFKGGRVKRTYMEKPILVEEEATDSWSLPFPVGDRPDDMFVCTYIQNDFRF